jgi:hypothetical protein
MRQVKIHRLFLRLAAPIVSPMKNTLYRYPTVQELRALEVSAHRARAREVARLLRSGVQALKSLAGHLTVVHGGERIGHA